jgi:hypothetical protein
VRWTQLLLIGAVAGATGTATALILYLWAYARSIDGPLYPQLIFLIAVVAISALGAAIGAVLGYPCATSKLYRWGPAPLLVTGGLLGGLAGVSGLSNTLAAATSGMLGGLLAHYLYCGLCLLEPALRSDLRSSMQARSARDAVLAIAVLAAAVPLYYLDSYVAGSNERAVNELLTESLALIGLTDAVTDDGWYQRHGPPRDGCDWIGGSYVEINDGVDRRPDAETIATTLETESWEVTRLYHEDLHQRFSFDAVKGQKGLSVVFRSNSTWVEALYGTCTTPFAPRTPNSSGTVIEVFDLALVGL